MVAAESFAFTQGYVTQICVKHRQAAFKAACLVISRHQSLHFFTSFLDVSKIHISSGAKKVIFLEMSISGQDLVQDIIDRFDINRHALKSCVNFISERVGRSDWTPLVAGR